MTWISKTSIISIHIQVESDWEACITHHSFWRTLLIHYYLWWHMVTWSHGLLGYYIYIVRPTHCWYTHWYTYRTCHLHLIQGCSTEVNPESQGWISQFCGSRQSNVCRLHVFILMHPYCVQCTMYNSHATVNDSSYITILCTIVLITRPSYCFESHKYSKYCGIMRIDPYVLNSKYSGKYSRVSRICVHSTVLSC